MVIVMMTLLDKSDCFDVISENIVGGNHVTSRGCIVVCSLVVVDNVICPCGISTTKMVGIWH